MLATRSERREEINANLSHAKKQGRIRRVDKIPFAAFSTSKHPDLAKTKCDRRKKAFRARTTLQPAAREFHKSRSSERPRVYLTLKEGDNVYFEIVQGEKGTQGVSVEKVQKGWGRAIASAHIAQTNVFWNALGRTVALRTNSRKKVQTFNFMNRCLPLRRRTP